MKSSFCYTSLSTILFCSLYFIFVKRNVIFGFIKGLHEESNVNGLSLWDLIVKFHQFFMVDYDDVSNRENIWEKDVHLCSRSTTYWQENPKLYCYYQWTPLHISPLKVEILNKEPLILQYLNVITEQQADVIIRLSARHLQNATAYNPLTGKFQESAYRRSHISFFHYKYFPQSYNLNFLTESIMGFSSLDKEFLQIARYQSGDHYGPHYDFYDAALFSLSESYHQEHFGNRMATVLYYLKDCPNGGGTIFPRLNITLTPRAGDAILWYNVRSDGTLDRRTWHGGCPIAQNQPDKWIANIWVREVGQEFNKKCSLESKFYK